MTTTVDRTEYTTEPLPSLRPIVLPITGLLLAQFTLVLSGTMIATSLPTLMGALEGPHSHATWLVAATILANTASIPIWGKLTDRINPKTILIVSLVIFIVGAVMASFTTTTWAMLIARAIQGVAIGGLAATVVIVIAHLVGPRQRGRVNGWLTSSQTVAQIAGPALGGLIVQSPALGWRWCFLILVPASLIALVVIVRTLRVTMPDTPKQPLDLGGMFLSSTGVTALLIGVTAISEGPSSVLTAIMCLAYAAVALTAFVYVEFRVTDPIVPLRLLGNRISALATIAAFSVGSTFFVGTVFMTQYLQFALGFAPAVAGVFLIPMAAATVLTSIIAGRYMGLTARLRPVLIYGIIVLFAGVCLLAAVAVAPLACAIGGTLLLGSGLGALAQNLVIAPQSATPAEHVGSVSATVMFLFTLGGAVGLVCLGAVLTASVDPLIASGVSTADAYARSIPGIFQITALAVVPAVVCILSLPAIRLRSHDHAPADR